MKNKKILFIIIPTILIASIWIIFFYSSDEDYSEIFNIEDTSKVYQVSISNDIENITIKKIKNTNKWFVNSRYEANERSIKRLIQAMQEVKINRPVKNEKLDSVKTILNEKGISVQIFNKNEEILKSWLIGPCDEHATGTYMMKKGQDQPFIVNIPGLENDLNYRYNTNSIYWIKTELFSYKPSEIKEIELIYYKDPAKSFRLVFENNDVQLFSESSETQADEINYNNVGNYLTYFMNVKFSSFYESKNQKKDSLLNAIPEYKIILKDKYNMTKNVKLFLIKDSENQNKLDLNRMNAIINNEDPVIVKYYDIDLILKDIDYFIN